MLRIISPISGVLFATLLLMLTASGCGPRVDIPADAELGKEYAAAGEEQIAEETAQLVLNSIKEKYRDGQRTLRDAHPFAHGCVRATFTVQENVPAGMKHGVFAAPGSFPAWIRFSEGSTKPKPDADGGIRGMGIKLSGVPGAKIQNDEQRTQDFLVISNPVLPVGDPGEYLALFRAALAGKPMGYFFGGAPWNWKLGALGIVSDIRGKEIPSMLQINYWSTVPFQLGKDAVKYSARPCDHDAAAAATVPENPSDHYLRETMAAHLKEKSACFEFMIQTQTDAQKMPVEDPAVVWDETASPFVTVAKIEIPKQTFDTAAQKEFCENLTFNPWHSLPAHRPLGGINRVRKVAYDRIAKYRLEKNKIPRKEPNGNERFE